MTEDQDIAIGIDLGTTNCCVSVIRSGKPETIPNCSGLTTTPSYVVFEESGDRIVGQQAKDSAHISPERTIFAIKRIFGKRFSEKEVSVNQKRWPFTVAADQDGFAAVELPGNSNTPKLTLKPEEVSAEVLKYLKQTAEDFLGHPVSKAVITVPANYTERQRRATYIAGELAGLDVVGIINEPTAAAVAYGLQSKEKDTAERTILVCDLGGGTMDVSIIKSNGQCRFKVICTAGNMQLGGQDFDERILEHFISEFENLHGTGIRNSSSALAILRRHAEIAKQTLSAGNSDKAKIAINSLFNRTDFKTTLTRTVFEEICSSLFDIVLDPIQTALNNGKMTPRDITHIVLVGGSSRIPKFRELVGNFFPNQPLLKDIHPDEAIAHGAAIMAQQTDQVVDLEDVTATSLGTEVFGGEMSVILPQFSPIPSTAQKIFTTGTDFQTRATIQVYEGEDPIAKKNLLWGKLMLTGIRPAVKGKVKIDVTYEYDKFGMLKVSAKEEGTQNEVDMDISLKKD